ncbi:MAG TPA: hypothetical protein RMH99_23895 [Sandaracinaceae bacterium LLY-WYZ-13_1]|nr:hypothetical protein [Sandaracinaceae bacterium LLY-WYZ-13_1]
MGLIGGIWLAVLGVLGAANLIIARRPDAKEYIAKIAPYQGWIGAVSALWGVWMCISSVLSIGWLAVAPIYWVTYLADGVLQLLLGLLLGIGVLKQFIKAPAATEKMDALIAKIAPYQGVLGLIAIGVGLWMIVAGFLFSVA